MNAMLEPLPESEDENLPAFILQKLNTKHKEALALVAQGMPLNRVGPLVGYTKEYVGMLLRQPLAKEYLAKMNEAVGTRLEAMFEQSVEVIADTMKNGSNGEKLKAARLQLEATKRIGRGDTFAVIAQNSDERLGRLADRLVSLLNHAKGNTFNEDGTPAESPEVLKYVSGEPSGQTSPTEAS
jgi:hypothetical protein